MEKLYIEYKPQNNIKGYNQSQIKTLNIINKILTDKKEITDVFGSFF